MVRAYGFNPANMGNVSAGTVRATAFATGAATGVNTTIGIPAVATYVVTAGIITSAVP